MTAIMIVSGLFALGALAVTILPFFTGRGGFLAAAGTINDPIRLEAMKVAIVARYVKEEVTFAEGDLSKREWTRRQEYLRHRYIDLVRRLDFLRRVGSSSTAKSLIIALAFGGLDQLLLPQTASAAVVIGQRHAIMLRGGVDQIWGHYVFTLQNDSKVTGEFTTPVMLPTGAIDIRPQEGLTPEEVVISDDGRVALRKKVDPGVHMVSFGFIVESKSGNSHLEFEAPYPVQELQILVPKNTGIEVSGAGLNPHRNGQQPGVWSIAAPLAPADRLVFDVSGVAEGRQRLWIMGLSVAALLVGLGAGLAWWSRPKRKEEVFDEEALGT